MRFMLRSLAGLLVAGLSLGLLALGVGIVIDASTATSDRTAGGAPAEERAFAVNVATFEPVTVTPVLTAYGDLRSARQLELRAETGGRLIELAPGFQDGGRVQAGETLFRVDPADAETALAIARSDLAAARAEAAEARANITLAEEDRAVAERQRDLRAGALDRTRGLRRGQIATEADLEAAELALSTAEQVLTGRRLALAQATALIERLAIAQGRAAIARDEAARRLANTTATAPFAGILTDVSAVLGRLVSANEKLGLLLDPAALEVAFRVSNADFARLADASGEVLPLDLTVRLAAGGRDAALTGRIDRVGASVGEGQTGRLVYGRLDADRRGLLRPGDFLTVEVTEPALADVAVVPATAVGPDSTMLLVGAQDRLEEVPVGVLRRQGDTVIVAGGPAGRSFVTARPPQLAPGILVRPIKPEGGADAMVRLTPERRAGLIEALRANQGLAEGERSRMIATLEADVVPQSMIDRLERPAGG